MNRIILFLGLVLFSFNLDAQTKLIHHKGHSGSKASFKSALSEPIWGLSASNFGEPPWWDAMEDIDSVICINPNMAVVVKQVFCLDSTTFVRSEEACQLKRDTLMNHPLLSQQHDLDNVKLRLRGYFDFKNSMETIVFVGYDNEQQPMPDTTPEPVETIKETTIPEIEQQVIEETPVDDNVEIPATDTPEKEVKASRKLKRLEKKIEKAQKELEDLEKEQDMRSSGGKNGAIVPKQQLSSMNPSGILGLLIFVSLVGGWWLGYVRKS